MDGSFAIYQANTLAGVSDIDKSVGIGINDLIAPKKYLAGFSHAIFGQLASIFKTEGRKRLSPYARSAEPAKTYNVGSGFGESTISRSNLMTSLSSILPSSDNRSRSRARYDSALSCIGDSQKTPHRTRTISARGRNTGNTLARNSSENRAPWNLMQCHLLFPPSIAPTESGARVTDRLKSSANVTLLCRASKSSALETAASARGNAGAKNRYYLAAVTHLLYCNPMPSDCRRIGRNSIQVTYCSTPSWMDSCPDKVNKVRHRSLRVWCDKTIADKYLDRHSLQIGPQLFQFVPQHILVEVDLDIHHSSRVWFGYCYSIRIDRHSVYPYTINCARRKILTGHY